ncbi:MAG: DNA/RNA non-specific endonuclease [Lachnospiraceae bacterium]|nr:DNA/RNA non-specific endonuclease [Lachnospiraceae bacterium]
MATSKKRSSSVKRKVNKFKKSPLYLALVLILGFGIYFVQQNYDPGEFVNGGSASEQGTDYASGNVTENDPEKSSEKSSEGSVTGFIGDTGLPSEIEKAPVSLSDIPAYSGASYAVLNNDVPYFENKTYTTSFEFYGELDELKRCTTCYVNVGKDVMPTEERGDIGSVKPTGWHTVKYDCVDGKYLYNRCHLIGYQLTAENANKQNLITGTRYLNIVGMLYFENEVANYVKETGNHVLYRVTPYFEGEDLVAKGVLMEAWSVEDNGKGVCFCAFAYNVQPGVVIDYATGESRLATEEDIAAGLAIAAE